MRPGWKTTEFWMALAAKLIGLALVVLGRDDVQRGIGGLLATGSVASYALSRGKAKMNVDIAAEAAAQAALAAVTESGGK